MDRKTYEIVDGPREKHLANTELINAAGSEMINLTGEVGAATQAGEVTKNQAYKESGSKLSYKDWLDSALKSGELDSLKQKIADAFKKRKNKGGDSTDVKIPPPDNTPIKPTYILGMKPFVAVMVGVAAISLIAYGAYKFANRKKG